MSASSTRERAGLGRREQGPRIRGFVAKRVSSTHPPPPRGPQGTLGTPSILAEGVPYPKSPRGKGREGQVLSRVFTVCTYPQTDRAFGLSRQYFFRERGREEEGGREGLLGIRRMAKTRLFLNTILASTIP